jgi:hypothetical protein
MAGSEEAGWKPESEVFPEPHFAYVRAAVRPRRPTETPEGPIYPRAIAALNC